MKTIKEKFIEVFKEKPKIDICPIWTNCKECKYTDKCNHQYLSRPTFWNLEWGE